MRLRAVIARSLAVVLLPSLVLAGGQTAGQSTNNPATAAKADSAGLFDEPHFLTKGMDRLSDIRNEEHARPKDGFYVNAGNMITGGGWISLGPGYRHHLLNERAVVDLSGAVSWRAYKTAQARVEFPYLANERLAVGTQVVWQDFTQIRYFGTNGSDMATDYRLRSTNAVGYAIWRVRPALELSAEGGWLTRPDISGSAGSFDRDEPDPVAVYAGDPAVGLDRQPRFIHAELAVLSDTRDERGYTTRGGVYRASFATYRDRAAGAFTFDRFEAEGAQFVPVFDDLGVLALHAWTVFSNTGDSGAVPFYFMPSLGGGNTVRGYSDYRFHGRHLAVVNLESRWALTEHVDAALFYDAGNVAARIADLDFDRSSYGIGVRVHTPVATVARFDIAHGADGWRYLFRVNDVFRFRRFARHTAPIPFAP